MSNQKNTRGRQSRTPDESNYDTKEKKLNTRTSATPKRRANKKFTKAEKEETVTLLGLKIGKKKISPRQKTSTNRTKQTPQKETAKPKKATTKQSTKFVKPQAKTQTKQSNNKRRRREQKDPYTSVKNRPTRLIFNRTSGASTRADFEADKSRYHFIWLIAGCLFAVLLLRAFQIQVLNAKVYQEKGNQFITSVRTVPTYRGMIVDRNNHPLAVSAPLVTVSFSPYEYAKTYYEIKQKIAKNPTDTALVEKLTKRLAEIDLTRLASVANIDVTKLEEVAHITNNVNLIDDKAVQALIPKGAGSHYFPLLTKVPPEMAEGLLALDFLGVYKEEFYQRYYPQSYPTSQLLGFMGQNANDPEGGYQGRAGLERKFEKQLAGKDGKVLVLRDAQRASLKEVKQLEQDVDGQDVQLTIDSRLQFLLYQELEKVSKYQKANWASGIIVDVQTGEVLAMSSWPSYNANNLNDMTGDNQRNRVLIDSFEPGSVVKPFTVAAALESAKFAKYALIDTSPGSIKVKGYTIRDHANLGRIGFATLLKKSSNVASTKIALSLPPDGIANMQRKFGLGQKTHLDFPGEQSGAISTPKQSQTARRATMSYGYGLKVTLAQLAQAYAALSSGGILHPLSLVKSETKTEGKQILAKDHALSIVEMMESVTQHDGTAPAAAIDGYRVAGKTGTARRVNPKGGYFSDQYRTTFVGMAPVSNPQLVVAILVENPQVDQYAGDVAAPAFHNVMKEALRLYNVPLDKPLKVKKTEAN